MYKLEVKVHIEGNNYYEKNRNTIQLLPENVDGFRHLTKNISAIFIATKYQLGRPYTGNYLYCRPEHISLHSHAQCRSLTHRHCPYYNCPPIIATVCSLVCRE